MPDHDDLCLCGHKFHRHVPSSTRKSYCIDCHCGDFEPPAPPPSAA